MVQGNPNHTDFVWLPEPPPTYTINKTCITNSLQKTSAQNDY